MTATPPNQGVGLGNDQVRRDQAPFLSENPSELATRELMMVVASNTQRYPGTGIYEIQVPGDYARDLAVLPPAHAAGTPEWVSS
jgi:hypothetical protein